MTYDYKTTNISFIQIASELKKLGIKNNKFHLILYDEKLLGVDPYDENLSLEMQVRIRKEIQINCWYYLRNVVRIPVPAGKSCFILHRGNLAEIFCLLLNLNTMIELPRQHFKTYSAVSFYSWLYLFVAENYNIMFSNKQLADSQLNIKRLNDLVELLPSYLKTHLDPKLDSSNINLISINKLNNNIKAMSTGRDKASADKIGRGNTVPSIWFDEFAFLAYNETTYKASKPALNTAIDFAKKNNSPYGILITTTPNNLDQPEGKFCYEMIQKAAKFDERFYDWYDWLERDSSKIIEYIEVNSANNFVYIEFSYKQLGKDEAWFKKQVKELEGDMLLVKREILLQWTYASNVSPFSEEQLITLEQYSSEKELFKKIYMNNYIIDIIETPKNMFAKNWIMSIDVGGGLGIDGSAFTVIDPSSMKPIMKFNNNTISIPDFAVLIEKFVIEYIPNAVIVPERNNAGIALIQILQKSLVSKNLFYEIKEKVAEKTVENSSIFKISKNKKIKKETRVYGMTTNSKTRDIMINQILFMIVNDKPYLINNKELFNEIRTLYRNPRGKIEHASGFHDDMLFSYLIGIYVFKMTIIN